MPLRLVVHLLVHASLVETIHNRILAIWDVEPLDFAVVVEHDRAHIQVAAGFDVAVRSIDDDGILLFVA